MMTIQPNDTYPLNACLARVIGLKWGFNTGTLQLGYFEGDTLKYAQNEWDPVHNANQLEEVEAWLKQNGIEFIISSAHLCNLIIVELILADGIFQGKDPDKKRAFALAVQAMEQGKS